MPWPVGDRDRCSAPWRPWGAGRCRGGTGEVTFILVWVRLPLFHRIYRPRGAMGSRISHRAVAAAFGLLTAGATALILMAGHTPAQAAVWTDQPDYSPGSVVTFHGDNSDGVGYQGGETVHVDVNGPGSITQSCDAAVDNSGAWSCQTHRVSPGNQGL